MTIEEEIMEIKENIKVIVKALLEQEKTGQFSQDTIQELKWIA
jgi:hypothetical protein